jgi:hypothetical protein
MKSLSSQVEVLKRQCNQFRERIKLNPYCWEALTGKDDPVRFLTGFEDAISFQVFFNSVGPVVNHLCVLQGDANTASKNMEEWSVLGSDSRQHQSTDELLMTLSRSRLGLLEDVAMRWDISQSNVSRIFQTWVTFLYHHLPSFDWWLPKCRINIIMPQIFRDQYPNTRAMVNATEIYIQQPSDEESQVAMLPSYNHHFTVKELIGISLIWSIAFVSKIYNGTVSDVQPKKYVAFWTSWSPAMK